MNSFIMSNWYIFDLNIRIINYYKSKKINTNKNSFEKRFNNKLSIKL